MINKMISDSQIMTTAVITVDQYDKLSHIGHLFDMNNIHHLPVIDEDEVVVGIISRLDYNKALHHYSIFNPGGVSQINDHFMKNRYAMEIMTKNVVKLNPEDQLELAIHIFAENLFHALPVVNKIGKIEGILTTFDLINYAYNDRFQLNPL